MQHHYTVSAALLWYFSLSSCFAAPQRGNSGSRTQAISYTDKFDDRTALSIGVGLISNVGTYHGLNYSGFGVQSDDTSVLLSAPSPPNFIFGGATSTANKQLLPANASVLYFDLESIYYACGDNGAYELGVAQSCTIQFAGRKAAQFGGQTAVKELVFDAKLLEISYNFANFPREDFQGLVEVSIAVISSETGTSLTTIPLFDNVAYTAHIVQ